METLQELVHNLDYQLGSISNNVKILSDIKVHLIHLRDRMETVSHEGQEKFYYMEHLRQLRIWSELMQFTMKELAQNEEKAYVISNGIFSIVSENNEVISQIAK